MPPDLISLKQVLATARVETEHRMRRNPIDSFIDSVPSLAEGRKTSEADLIVQAEGRRNVLMG